MSISRRIARPLLAAVFIAEGLDAIRNPDPTESSSEAGTPPTIGESVARENIPLVRLNGVVQVGGGALLAIGKFPRLASLALMASIVPTTYAGHRFWEEPDADLRNQQKMQLLKNLGLLGGLIFSAVDTDGAPSVSWRTRRRVHEVANTLSEVRTSADGQALSATSRAADVGRTTGRRARRAARRATLRANATATGAARQASEIATHASRTGVDFAAPAIRHANEGVIEAAGEAIEIASPYIAAGLERAGEFIDDALEVASPYVSAGLERAGELLTRLPHHPSTD